MNPLIDIVRETGSPEQAQKANNFATAIRLEDDFVNVIADKAIVVVANRLKESRGTTIAPINDAPLAPCKRHHDQQVGEVAKVGPRSDRGVRGDWAQDHESDRPAPPPRIQSGHCEGRGRQSTQHQSDRLPIQGVRDSGSRLAPQRLHLMVDPVRGVFHFKRSSILWPRVSVRSR